MKKIEKIRHYLIIVISVGIFMLLIGAMMLYVAKDSKTAAIGGWLFFGTIILEFILLMIGTIEIENTKEKNRRIEQEKKCKSVFKKLDIYELNIIAKMITRVKESYNKISDSSLHEIDICKLILDFCIATYEFNNEKELNDFFTDDFYMNKALNLKIVPESNYGLLKALIIAMPDISKTVLYKSISPTSDSIYNDESRIDSLFSRIEPEDRDLLRYIIESLAVCTGVAKIIFVKKKVDKITENNDFYKIISNMSEEIKDVNVIINKSRPIYDEFYKQELGNIDDMLLYAFAVAIIDNRIKNKKDPTISKKEEKILDMNKEKINDISSFEEYINEWILNTAKQYPSLIIDNYLIYKIKNSINSENFNLLIDLLGKKNQYSNFYYDSVEHNKKLSDKERYLKGNFEKEKIELSGKYTLNNITSGQQFEIYLTNLFNELNYKTKHCGKTGDQGADLILKKDDYVYAVQAKYYTGKLGNTPIQEITGALKYYNANQGVVITNSEFTTGAEKLAKANNVILIDGKDLKKLIDFTFQDDHSDDVLKKFEK